MPRLRDVVRAERVNDLVADKDDCDQDQNNRRQHQRCGGAGLLQQAQVPKMHHKMNDQDRDRADGGNLGEIERMPQQHDESCADEQTLARSTVR